MNAYYAHKYMLATTPSWGIYKATNLKKTNHKNNEEEDRSSEPRMKKSLKKV